MCNSSSGFPISKPNAPVPASRSGDLPPTASSGPRRIPISGVSSLVSPGARLLKPGYTGTRPGFSIKGKGSRELPPTSLAPAEGKTGPRADAAEGSRVNPLTMPGRAPSTTQPLHAIRVDPGAEFVRKNPPSMSIAHSRPINGHVRMVAPGVAGGAPLPTSFAYTGVSDGMPFDRMSRERWRAFDLQVRHARVAAKRPVHLTAGPSPLQYAQAPRINPTTPSLVRGIGRQELGPPTRVYGTLDDAYRVPNPTRARLIHEAQKANPR